jgi:hypothetical protein
MTIEEFLSKLKTSEGCSLWDGAILQAGGYGLVHIGSLQYRAHVLSYMLTKGPIPEGMYVCHKCDTPACIKPEHLFLGTPSENSYDAMVKGRHHKPFYSGEIWLMKRLYICKISLRAIAKMFKTNHQRVGNIIRNPAYPEGKELLNAY